MKEDSGKRRQPRLGLKIRLALGLVIIAVPAVLFLLHVRSERRAALASMSKGPLAQLALALHNYHEAFGCLPPAYIADENGKPIHSWRALILPWIDEGELHKQYSFKEPWDGPNNIKLVERLPSILHCPSEPESTRFTNYVAIVGPQTPFPGAGCTKFDDFKDGRNQTILVAEIADSDIRWSEPRDLNVEKMSFQVNDKQQPSISSNRQQGPYVTFADSAHAYRLNCSLSAEALRSLTTISGREPMSLAELDVGLVDLTEGPATDAGLLRFDRWEAARIVWLSRSPITDRGIAGLDPLPLLTQLNLAGTQISDAAIPHLNRKKFNRLLYLNVSGTDITDEGFTTLKAALPDTAIIR